MLKVCTSKAYDDRNHKRDGFNFDWEKNSRIETFDKSGGVSRDNCSLAQYFEHMAKVGFGFGKIKTN